MIHEIRTSEDLAVHEGTAVLLFTQPSSCVPCRQLEPHFERLAASRDDVEFLRVNLDDADPMLAQQYMIMSVPQLFLLDGDSVAMLSKRNVVGLSKEIDNHLGV